MAALTVALVSGETFTLDITEHDTCENVVTMLQERLGRRAITLFKECGAVLASEELVMQSVPSLVVSAFLPLEIAFSTTSPEVILADEGRTATKAIDSVSLSLCGPTIFSGCWSAQFRLNYSPESSFSDAVGLFGADAPSSMDCSNGNLLAAAGAFLKIYGRELTGYVCPGRDAPKRRIGTEAHISADIDSVVSVRADFTVSAGNVHVTFQAHDWSPGEMVVPVPEGGMRFGAFIYKKGHSFTIVDVQGDGEWADS